ncbi:glycosyltransferase [Paenibacillus sp. NPDC056722]|uniref:glycosyltransferase n=1 Tax=Paenibacillus sp. NPDC056722 TaxID=3345924 RepID=UPI00367A1DA5
MEELTQRAGNIMKQLSVCMIVKDEEALLPRCLNSVSYLADEIIIVDTGSKDQTKQIAADFNAKIFEYTWNNDFAAARNESLRHATGKWILVLDADEYLGADDLQKWSAFLREEQPQSHLAYTLSVINFTGDNDRSDEINTAPVTRLFPNFKGIHFERPIHEQLTRGRSKDLFHKNISLSIYHTGYQTQRVTEKNKHERNMQIFNKMKESNKLSDYDWFTLGNQYRYGQEDDEALRCYERALKGGNSQEAWYPHCLLGAIGLYYKRNSLAQSWGLTESKLSKYQDFSEYYTIKGIHLEKMGFLEQATSWYLKAIDVAEQRTQLNQEAWLSDPMYSFETPAQQLVDIYFRLNDNQQAIYWLSKLLNKDTRNVKVLLRLVEWLCLNEEPSAVIGFLDKIYDVREKAESSLLFKISLVLGQAELVHYYEQLIDGVSTLNTLDELRYTTLTGTKESWESLTIPNSNKDQENELQLWAQIVIATIKWGTYKKFEEVTRHFKNESIPKLNELVLQMLTGKAALNEQSLEMHANSLFLVAKQLFLIREYELFDQFIQAFKSAELINQLANYFYSLNMTEMAMNYYSILLSQQQLNFNSLVNLGFYHANQGYDSDAVEFISEALKLQPKASYLYYVLIQHAPEGQKNYFIEKFIAECPELVNITFVLNFLNGFK